MKKQGKLLKFIKATASFALLFIAVFCVFRRLPECFSSEDSAVLAAAFTLTDGKYITDKNKADKLKETTPKNTKSENTDNTNSTAKANNIKRDKSGYYDSFAEHSGETKHSITEKSITGNATQVNNFYIKNRTGLDLEFEKILSDKLPFSIKKNSESPQVLIYHTHTSEAYIDEDVDYFYDSFYSRTQNNNFNVVAVGDAISQVLESKGIKTLHDKTVHDSSYNGSYGRSAQTIQSDMNENKEIKVVLDIHRDALGTDECKVKPVFEYKGKKCAQIMILSGCDTDGERDFENWQNNLNFALKIQNTAEKMYPGMTRPISFDYFAYNEYICDGSLLIEVGAEANSIDEAVNTGELLGNVLYEVLK